MRPYSIRNRLTRTVLIFFFAAVTAGVGAIYALVRSATEGQFHERLLERAVAISARITRSGEVDDAKSNMRAMRAFDVDQELFEIWKQDGTVLTLSENLGGGNLPFHAGVGTRPYFQTIRLGGRKFATVYLRVQRPKEADEGREEHDETPKRRPAKSVITGPMTLAVAMNRNDIDELLDRLAVICGLIVTALSAAAFLIPPVLRRLLRPLETLAIQTSAVDAGTLSTRLDIDGLPEELRPVAICLNDLFARLEAAFERERRVTADLAHELRTPLAELRTWADTAMKWPESRDPSTDAEIVAAVLHMQAIVVRMLALARSELGKMHLAREYVDIRLLLEKSFRGFSTRARAKDLHVRWDLEASSVETDSTLVQSILTNLYENAVEYTPKGGEIFVSCKDESGAVTICISNTVTNLEPEDVPQFFQRFWRKEESRSGEQHCGLGLAIAASFAKTLGWRLTAVLKDNILTFCLTAADRSG
ncbi:MAG TPA: ATP-binding protein [Rhizomicrobium sp.]|nr:ATP-binding protein [Rhizomicrobium sp.]